MTKEEALKKIKELEEFIEKTDEQERGFWRPKDGEEYYSIDSDGEECFGGGWFIVMATLPTGQISNHYEMKDWDLFQIPEKELADVWDGHTPQDTAKRLREYLKKRIEMV